MKLNVTKDQVRFFGLLQALAERTKDGDASFVPLSKAKFPEDLKTKIVYVDTPGLSMMSCTDFPVVKDLRLSETGEVEAVRTFTDPEGNVDIEAEYSPETGWCINVLVSDLDDPSVDYDNLPLDSEILERALIVIKDGRWEYPI